MAKNDSRTCAAPLAEYYKCLGSSGRDVSQCLDHEQTLRKCSEIDKENDYCVDEIVRLLRCTRNPNSNGCAKEFVTFRECNRPNGPEIIIKDGMYKIHPKHLSKYSVKSDTICPIHPPERNATFVNGALDKMKEALGLKNFKENYVPHIKS